MTGNVMVVDDTKFIRELIARYLELDGHSVSEAESGEGLVENLLRERVQLLILDVNMPGPSLRDNLQAVRSVNDLSHLPIIIVSGSDDADVLDSAFEMGANDFLQKPPNFHLLRSRVRAHLAKERAHSLKNQLQETWSSSILNISRVAENREPDTDFHGERMRKYCRVLADSYQKEHPDTITDSWIDNFVIASPLHDLGKSRIPDSILLKETVLSPEERDIIESHTIDGAKLVEQFLSVRAERELLTVGAEVTRSHHERWDGTGYPDKKVGAEIPLAARLLSICDVYDAIRSCRPHRKGVKHSAAVETIEQGRETQFDPAIVELFLREQEQFGQIFEQLQG